MIFPTGYLVEPSEEISKLESYVDMLDVVFSPSEEEKQIDPPIGINHFALLEVLKGGAVDPFVYRLARHYVNGLRQFCAHERGILMLEKKLAEAEKKLAEQNTTPQD